MRTYFMLFVILQDIRHFNEREALRNDLLKYWLFLEWILQNKTGHLMMFTQLCILNREQGREMHRTTFRERTAVLGV